MFPVSFICIKIFQILQIPGKWMVRNIIKQGCNLKPLILQSATQAIET